MAITGQFGKSVTGAGSLASAISGIASEYANLRITRIYNAFINDEVFEGRQANFAVALELLNKMLKRASKGGKMEAEIQDTIRNLRTSNRNRTLNNINTQLDAQGGTGDYANKVRVLKEMLLDQNIDPDERNQLQGLLNDAVADLLKNTQSQFLDGKKVTINGVEYDFAGKANEGVFLGLFTDMQAQFPEMADKIGTAQDLAKAAVLIRGADFDYAKSNTTTDSSNLAATKIKLAAYQKAYELLVASKYGLGTGADALSLLETIGTLKGNVTTLGGNVANKAGQDRFGAGRSEVYGAMDAIETAMRTQSPEINAWLGDASLSDMISSDANNTLELFDKFIAANGFDDSITTADGTKYDIDRESLYELIIDTKDDAKSFYDWAKNSSALSKSQKDQAKSIYTASLGMVGNIPTLKAEDRYDNARETLIDDLEGAGGNMRLRSDAIKRYAATLQGIARGVADLNSPAVNALNEEATFFLTGKPPKDGITYATLSGNYSTDDFFGSNEIAIAISSSTETGLTSALADFWKLKVQREQGQGDPVVGPDGDESDTLTPGHEELLGDSPMMLGRSTPTEYGEAEIDIFSGTYFGRTRILSAGYLASDDLDDSTVGWVTVYYDKNGKKRYIVTERDKNNKNKEYVLTEAVALQVIKLLGSPTTFNGDSIWVARSTEVTELITGGASSDSVSTSDIASGNINLINALKKAGYADIQTAGHKAEYDSLLTAVNNGDILYRNGKFIISDYDFGNGVKGTYDITPFITKETLAEVVLNATDFVVIIKRGSAGGDGPDEGWGDLPGPEFGGGNPAGGEGGAPPPPGSVPVFGGNAQTPEEQADAWQRYNKFRAGERDNTPPAKPAPPPPPAGTRPEKAPPVARGQFNRPLQGGANGMRIPQADLVESTKIFNTVMRNMPATGGGITSTTTPRKVVAYNPAARSTTKIAK